MRYSTVFHRQRMALQEPRLAVFQPMAGKRLEDLGRDMSVLGRLAEPENVANVIVFLASDESAYPTGAEFVGGGGGSSALFV